MDGVRVNQSKLASGELQDLNHNQPLRWDTKPSMPPYVAAIILDTNNITIDNETKVVTVQAGVVLEELVSSIRKEGGAIPIGTGPTVGVLSYVVNGGLDGYFPR